MDDPGNRAREAMDAKEKELGTCGIDFNAKYKNVCERLDELKIMTELYTPNCGPEIEDVKPPRDW